MSDTGAPEWLAVAVPDAGQDQRIVPIRVREHDLILVQDGSDLWACQRLCPHEYTDLSQGRVSGKRLFCGRHFASFDLSNGSSGNGWDLPRLKVYPARLRDGRIEVDASAVSEDPPVRRRSLRERQGHDLVDPAPPNRLS
ncbi:Rieske (2Fe-2S) protein [Mesorhizobium sp. CO1-1-8]|uniref:Rieske (2Fe-2S) protein n=1 Tax=Mesorhizobium sp. CO1-1-8 TaxID=2876631 RepID=UPI001CD0A99D|nr:Rieske 2Fe-2S domain-containing protein [Mesorhizobium sp. CO1-1-8]MBZ9772574.1 Rieske 2Fe-2S domain-containing protein [Mesorhizobium sp. CO1-1-8]